MTGLSLTSVGIGGGVDLAISGYNMASAFKSTNVMIGEAINFFCPIKSITDTLIVCRLPPIHEDYQPGDILQVRVLGRLLEESLCEGTCSLIYDESISAKVDPLISSVFRAG